MPHRGIQDLDVPVWPCYPQTCPSHTGGFSVLVLNTPVSAFLTLALSCSFSPSVFSFLSPLLIWCLPIFMTLVMFPFTKMEVFLILWVYKLVPFPEMFWHLLLVPTPHLVRTSYPLLLDMTSQIFIHVPPTRLRIHWRKRACYMFWRNTCNKLQHLLSLPSSLKYYSRCLTFG